MNRSSGKYQRCGVLVSTPAQAFEISGVCVDSCGDGQVEIQCSAPAHADVIAHRRCADHNESIRAPDLFQRSKDRNVGWREAVHVRCPKYFF